MKHGKKILVKGHMDDHWEERILVHRCETQVFCVIKGEEEKFLAGEPSNIHPWSMCMQIPPTKNQLVGKICAISDDSERHAKESVDDSDRVLMIDSYDQEDDCYFDGDGVAWEYAYPLTAEELVKFSAWEA